MNCISILVLSSILLFGCAQRQKSDDQLTPEAPSQKDIQRTELSEKEYYNKVLGLLLGSAIGDAMGAPTEMWSRKNIQTEYGFVHGLDTMVRAPSAEGTWKYNLPAGGTTDDTRWKKLFVAYAAKEPWPNLRALNFAQMIKSKYETDIEALKSTEGFGPAPYEENLMKMAWLQEWAVVADAYSRNDMNEYSAALSKFYGGEMTCAGMLYGPLAGACVPADPATAYRTGYDLSIFDIGYARDITALTAAMVSQAFDKHAGKSSITQVVRTVDPMDYFKSRLVGRSAYRLYQQANAIVSESKNLSRKDFPKGFKIPREWQPMDSLRYLQLSTAYSLLDAQNQDMPFHAAEIYLITLTSMIYCEYDFECTMEFIVNFGRDNDTAAAVAGAILGAYWGADRLPEKMVNQLLKVNRELLGTDLEEMAREMTAKYQSAK